MNKLIEFIQYLRKNRHRKVKTNELLEVLKLKSYKSIYLYKKQSGKLGINVRSYNGYYGGYQIEEKEDSFLTENDINYIKKVLPEQLVNKIIKINERVI